MEKKFTDNKILFVNLSSKKITEQLITKKLRRDYLGGAGINAKLLYDHVTPDIDALSPDNRLIFGVGVLAGSGFVAGARTTVTSKSPLSNIFADSNMGGFFGPKLRFCGYDHIVITGKSPEPVYLLISKDKKPELVAAGEIWGKNVHHVSQYFEQKYINCDVACIGTAGENLVRFANIICSHSHAAGRTGLGCVMGSKLLKAIVVQAATGKTPVYDQEKFTELKKKYVELAKKAPQVRAASENGSLFLVNVYNSRNWLTCENAQRGSTAEAENLYVDVFKEKYQKKKISCFGCPVACQKKYEIKEGKYKGKSEKIDFGSVAYLGPNLGVYNYPAVLYLDQLACDYGLDTMSLGAVIGFAMECFQRGLISEKDTDGLTLNWGDVEIIEKLIEKIRANEGFGRILARGVKIAGEILQAEEYAFNVKGIAVAPMPKNRNEWALGYTTSTRGGDHLKNFPFSNMFGPLSKLFSRKIFKTKMAINPGYPEDSGRVVWWHENYKSVIDSLGICIFVFCGVALLGNPLYKDFAEIFQALTGYDVDDLDILHSAERIYQIEKAFNAKHGICRKMDRLPIRKSGENVSEEYAANIEVNLDHSGMLAEYYQYRGYNQEGLPTVNRLQEIGLGHVINDLNEIVKDEPVMSIKDILETVNINI